MNGAPDRPRAPSRGLPSRRVRAHADGRHAGSLQRVVIDGETWDPRALIVRETEWFSGRTFAPGAGMMVAEVIVPLDAVASASHEEIRLSLDARATRRLPPYLSYPTGRCSGGAA